MKKLTLVNTSDLSGEDISILFYQNGNAKVLGTGKIGPGESMHIPMDDVGRIVIEVNDAHTDETHSEFSIEGERVIPEAKTIWKRETEIKGDDNGRQRDGGIEEN